MPLRTTLSLVSAALAAALLSASTCRGAGHSTPASGPASGTGGATPSQGRDMAGAAGDSNPSNQRAYAGNAGRPGVTAGALAGKSWSPDAGTLSAGPCTRDDECALTRMIPGECCDDCSERAVLRAPLEQRELDCEGVRNKCPAMPCAPQRFLMAPVCRDGQCAAKRVSND